MERGEGLVSKETVVLRRCVAVWGSQENLALSTELKMQTCHHKEFSKLTSQSLALGQNEGLTLWKLFTMAIFIFNSVDKTKISGNLLAWMVANEFDILGKADLR